MNKLSSQKASDKRHILTAILVAYNPNEQELVDNLIALQTQVDNTIVCNNSSTELFDLNAYPLLKVEPNFCISKFQSMLILILFRRSFGGEKTE